MASDSFVLGEQLEQRVGGFFHIFDFDETHVPLVYRETVNGPFYKGNIAEDFFVSKLSVDDVDINLFSDSNSELVDKISNRSPFDPRNPNLNLNFSYFINKQRLTIKQLRKNVSIFRRLDGEDVLY
ncbi:MAG: hypothetical protein WC852_01320 [Candidatus Nanoarchaeia archaeon]|jgi:hypothetical protein